MEPVIVELIIADHVIVDLVKVELVIGEFFTVEHPSLIQTSPIQSEKPAHCPSDNPI